MDMILAVILGTLFGFVLQRIGAADPDKIVGMLTLRDFHLMKAILTGIGTATLLLFTGLQLGLIDPAHLSIKALYLGVAVGGILLGVGWAISGFCPGTGVVAAGSGRRDALFFIVGGLGGAWIFALMFESLQATFLFTKLLGGEVSLVQTGAAGPAIIEAGWSPLLALAIGGVMLVIAKLLPLRR